MPVGPSHSGRSSGGSFNSSHSGSPRNFGGPRPEPHRPHSNSFVNGMIGGMVGMSIANSRRDRFERRYGIRPSDEEFNALPSRRKPTGFLVLSIIFSFFAIITIMLKIGASSNINYNKKIIQTMEADQVEYNTLIQNANVNGTNGYFLTTAEFDMTFFEYYGDNPTKPGAYFDFEEDGVSYYFIVYEYEDKRTDEDYIGTTYTQFTANQVQNLGGTIEIAYYSKAGEDRYSINTSYKLESCKEYQKATNSLESNKSLASGSLVAFIINLVIVAGFIALYIVNLKKYNKLVEGDEEILFQKKKAETEKAQAEANEIKSRTNRYCRYCGSKIDANSIKCTSCGAKLTK